MEKAGFGWEYQAVLPVDQRRERLHSFGSCDNSEFMRSQSLVARRGVVGKRVWVVGSCGIGSIVGWHVTAEEVSEVQGS